MTTPVRWNTDHGVYEQDAMGRARKTSDYPPTGFYPLPEWKDRPDVPAKHGPYSDVETRHTHWKTPDPLGLGRRMFWQSGPAPVWTPELYRPGLYRRD